MTLEPQEELRTHRLAKNKLVLMITGAIILALLLVIVAMIIYRASGAAQVDLSRPGYSAVRKQSINNDTNKPFNSSGPITKEVLDDFEKRYQEKSEQITSTRVFDASAMSHQTLQIPEQ